MSPAGPDFGDDDEAGRPSGKPASPTSSDGAESGANIYAEDENAVPFVRPFENLPELPEDVAEAFEALKLAILRHKTEEWQEISREDMLGTLEALKELALAPAAPNSSEF